MSDENTIDRRKVLKGIGAACTTGAALGATSGSAAAEGRGGSTMRYRSVEKADVEETFESEVGDLLDHLADEGLIGSPSTDDIATRSIHTGDDEGVFGMYLDDEVGSRTVLTSVNRLDSGVLQVTVEPERDLTYAIFEPAGSDEEILYAPGESPSTLQDPGAESTCPSCECYYGRPCPYGGGYAATCYKESDSGYPCTSYTTCC